MALRLPQPMLARSGPLPAGDDYSFELKWDGFRALVARNGDFRVRSRRGWEMTALLPELGDLPVRGVFDGELVAFAGGVPHFPLVCERLLHGERSVPLTFVLFDVLELEGEIVMSRPYAERRALLDELNLGGGPWLSPMPSATAPRCSRRPVSGGSRVSLRSGGWSPTDRVSAVGSRSRTAATGATARRSSRRRSIERRQVR